MDRTKADTYSKFLLENGYYTASIDAEEEMTFAKIASTLSELISSNVKAIKTEYLRVGVENLQRKEVENLRRKYAVSFDKLSIGSVMSTDHIYKWEGHKLDLNCITDFNKNSHDYSNNSMQVIHLRKLTSEYVLSNIDTDYLRKYLVVTKAFDKKGEKLFNALKGIALNFAIKLEKTKDVSFANFIAKSIKLVINNNSDYRVSTTWKQRWAPVSIMWLNRFLDNSSLIDRSHVILKFN